MALLDIKILPDPVLREVAEEITVFDKDLEKLAGDMFDTMYAAKGIGLAAPQIGLSRQLIVIDISEDGNERLALVNPKITAQSGSVSSEEGCLSIPDYRDTIKRSKQITVTGHDIGGSPVEITAEGLLAICLQHEIDHLNGVLFVDHLSRLKRELFKRWLKKQTPDAG